MISNGPRPRPKRRRREYRAPRGVTHGRAVRRRDHPGRAVEVVGRRQRVDRVARAAADRESAQRARAPTWRQRARLVNSPRTAVAENPSRFSGLRRPLAVSAAERERLPAARGSPKRSNLEPSAWAQRQGPHHHAPLLRPAQRLSLIALLKLCTRCVNPVWLAWVTVLQGGEHGTDEQWPRAAA